MSRFPRLALLTGVLVVGLATSMAFAEPGDNVQNISSGGADLGTNKCPGGSLTMAINGAPGVPDDYDIYIGSGYSTCTERARFVGVTGDGHRFRTTFTYARKGAEAVLPVDGVYRCWVAFGVKRKDRTFFTKKVRPEDPEVDNCPRG